MNTFIFQSTKDRFDLRREIKPEKTDTWYATRYRDDMSPGDEVFFWMAGDESIRGIYGSGEIISMPRMENSWGGHGVKVKYKKKFPEPILAIKMKSDSVLRNMLILKSAQATNFLLEPEEAKRIRELVATA